MRYAITGYGVSSSVGIGREAWEKSLSEGRDGFRAESQVLAEDVAKEVEQSAEVWDFDPKEWLGPKGHRNFDRLTKLMITAAGQALNDAAIKDGREFVSLSPEQVGISSATAYGSLDAITELNRVAELEDPRYINPARFPNTVINAAAGYVSIWEDLRAPNITTVDGNCGALDAVLAAATHLWGRRGDAFLIGGAEVMSDALVLAMSKLGAVKRGMRLGEGAAYAVLERVSDADARGANTIAELRGYGAAFSAHPTSATLLHADSQTVVDAIESALADAKLDISDVNFVASSLGGLALFDRAAKKALSSLFDESVDILRTKDFIGETFGASGAFALCHALAHIGANKDLNTPQVGLALTQGFYGNVSAVVITRGLR